MVYANLDANDWSCIADRPAGDRRTFILLGVEYGFRYCPPGTFWMGSLEDEEGRVYDEVLHKVRLTRGFWIQETQVTQEQWSCVMGYNPSYFSGSGRLPVECVSWYDCQDYLERLNSLELAPKEFRFSLPTEAQWEYACRAGTTTLFWWGNALNGDMANCNGNYPYGTEEKGAYLKKTTEVCSYPANPWGLYDMYGNVWEWCEDRYGKYPVGEATDPTGAESGSLRVLRGGGWNNNAVCCRAALRSGLAPDERCSLCGVRPVLVNVTSK